VNGSRDITRETFRDALIPIASDVSVLTAPDRFAESMDLVCHADGMEISQRIVELAKVLFDVVIIDTAGRMGPAVGGIIRQADVVLIVSDESELGLTAMDLLLTSIKPLIGGTDRLRFLIRAASDGAVDLKQISEDLESMHELNESCWSLPVVPFDPKVASWPGSGNTLYSAGNKDLNRVFREIAGTLGLLEGDAADSEEVAGAKVANGGRRGWLQRLFK
jgi:cellulose biosynthesis protein BcsQ